MSKKSSSGKAAPPEQRRRARLVLWVTGVIAIVGLAGGGIASSHLTSSLSDYDAPGSAVVLAQHQIQRVTGTNPEEGYVIVVRTASKIDATSPLPSRVAAILAILQARPEVKKVYDYANSGPSMISHGGNLTVIVATVGNVQEKQAVTALQAAIAAHPSLSGNVWLGGPTVADVQIASVSSKDLGNAELFALPFLILLLFLVFRGLRAAMVPLIGAVFAIAMTLGVMGLIIIGLPLSVFALNLVIALGLGLSVDFSLLIVSRFREEFRRQGSVVAALATVRRTAGHTVLVSSVTIAAAMATLAIFPERFVYSMGIAGAVVVLSAGAFALLVLPSLLTVYGERIVASRSSRRATAATADAGEISGRWYRIATAVMRRRVVWALSAVLILVLLAVPFLHVSFTGADASALPSSSSAGTAYELVQNNFAAFSEAPASLVVDAPHATPQDLASLAAKAASVEGVKGVSAFQHLGGSLWESNVALTSAPLSPEAQRSVTDLQSLSGPGHLTVIGQTASFLTLQKSLESRLPLVLGLIVLIALVMLFAMTRSLLLPLMAVVMNILTIGATFGVLVWAFQWGHLSRLLGFNGPGALQSTSLIIILAVVFGLSTDYGVFLLGRMKEEHDAGASADEAVARGLDRTGGIVSAAALCLALAMGALMLSQLVFVKELGLGVAFAVLLDATVVRAILVPALMKLLGNAAWWSPWSGRSSSPRATTPVMSPMPAIPETLSVADVVDPVSAK